MTFYKILDLVILILVSIFFVGMLGSEFPTLGIEQPMISIPVEWKSFFDFLMYPVFILLIIDLVLKYRKTNDPKKFVKKYWIDLTMLILIPIFSTFKFLKLGLSIIKKLKTVKMGAKIIHKTKKVSQK